MVLKYKFAAILIVLSFIWGCGNTALQAPVYESKHPRFDAPERYLVKPGDTLYSVAWSLGLDFRTLAQINNIPEPYSIHAGQVIVARPELRSYAPNAAQPSFSTQISQTTVTNPPKSNPSAIKTNTALTKLAKAPGVKIAKVQPVIKTSPVATTTKPAGGSGSIHWKWPTQGKIIKGFSPAQGNKGVNIAGSPGTPIYAAANGEVVYSGAGLRGYGKLIIIKHNEIFLSAYAHNRTILVKEGQIIKSGQKIAEMGNTGADRVMLHFEIRSAGKPVNPLNYLK